MDTYASTSYTRKDIIGKVSTVLHEQRATVTNTEAAVDKAGLIGMRSMPRSDRHAIWMRWFENEIEARYTATGGGLEIIADVLQEGFKDPKCFGFAFVHIVIEGGHFENEPFAIARKQKEHLRRFSEQLATKMGLQHPDMAASAAVLVIERTIVRTLMTGSLEEAQTARLLFQCLQHA
jgi:hypothetical protein